MDLRKKFEQGVESYTYQRIDSNYKVNIFLGYNDDGKMSMVITEDGKEMRVKSSKAIGVQMKKREDGKIALSFDLLDNSFSSMYLVFCKDMIIVLEHAGRDMAISSAILRWKYWIEMFGKKSKTILDTAEIKGLIGELIVLKDYMFSKYGVENAVESWMGPLLGHKDFEIGDTWYEVKSVNENAIQVQISSVEQLESEVDGKLNIIRLEATSTVSDLSINLNSLVLEIVNMIEEPSVMSAFRDKLERAGFAIDPDYENYNFMYKGMQRYIVNKEFPRIRRTNIDPAIGNAKYTIILDSIAKFKEE